MEINSYAKSDIGKVRGTNEDFFAKELINGNEHLFIVADGMGGHQAGNVASKLGTKIFIEQYRADRAKNLPISKSMLNSIIKANRSILKKANSDLDKRGMGTTFSAILISEYKAYIVHVGDSRIYQIRNNKIKKITTDHTFVEKMVDEGKITAEDARRHPQKNILYMSLGAREVFYPDDVVEFQVKDNDIFLLCSDGLTDMVTDDTIRKYSESYSAKKAVEELISLSNKTGGLDNITIQNIHIGPDKRNHDTEPIKIKKEWKKPFFLLLLAVIIAGIIIGVLIREPGTSPRVKFEPLSSAEKEKLSRKISWGSLNDNSEFNGLVSEKPLYVLRGKDKTTLFLRENYLRVSGGKVIYKNFYKTEGKKIILERIFFDNSTKNLIAIDEDNRIYKMKTIK